VVEKEVTCIVLTNACSTQYEFIVVNGQTTTSAFHTVVWQQYSGEMGKTTAIYVKFLRDVACQKILQSVNVSGSY